MFNRTAVVRRLLQFQTNNINEKNGLFNGSVGQYISNNSNESLNECFLNMQTTYLILAIQKKKNEIENIKLILDCPEIDVNVVSEIRIPKGDLEKVKKLLFCIVTFQKY